jgi:NADPH:quinone reductase-like Zn-dependent oxidoreductase
VEVNTARLDKIRELCDAGRLRADAGTILQLDHAKTAHEMLAGSPHPRGKIILNISG